MISDSDKILEKEQKGKPNLPVSNFELIKNQALAHPDRTAMHFFVDGATFDQAFSWTYKEFISEIEQTANLFRSLGIHRTDVLTYMLPNLPETIFTVMGGEVAGIVSSVNMKLEAIHIIEIMNAMGSKVLVSLSKTSDPENWKKVTAIAQSVSSLKSILTIDLNDHVKSDAEYNDSINEIEIFDFIKHRSKQKETLQFSPNIKKSDFASYFHTGGTTGRPKIAQRTHENEVFNTWAINDVLDAYTPKTFFCGLPWFHANGVVVTGFTVFAHGHTLVLGTAAGYRGNMVIANFWKIIEHYKISFFSSVPTILQYLLPVAVGQTDISSLENAICGAAPLSVKLFNDFESHSGVKLLEGYGFTEGTCVNSLNPLQGTRKIGSIGLRLPFHYMKAVLLDDEGHYLRDAKTDEIGIIVARGENVFPGYKEAIHNKNIWVNDGQYDWYNTGDLGREDEDHYFWLTGREKELIIRGGHNIDPKSIEEPLSQHPAVASVAAVGRPDKKVGELPVAYVVLKSGQSVSQDELVDFGKQNIAERAAQPKRIYFLDQLPLTAVGKVFKPKLSDLQNMEVCSEELHALGIFSELDLHVELTTDRGRVTFIKAIAKDGQNHIVRIKEALSEYTFPFEILM